MSWITRRRAITGTVMTAALVVTVLASMTASAAPSRASSRWNHVANAPTNNLDASTDPGTEPGVSGPAWKTLRVVEEFSNRFTFVDVGRKGDSPGDYGVFHDPIFSRGGMRIGTIDAQCIAAYADQCPRLAPVPRPRADHVRCISPLGIDPDHYAITGGTGQFAGAAASLRSSSTDIDAADHDPDADALTLLSEGST